MKYAKLIKLGGELIPAVEADYEDYQGFLRCPECGEPVFLRKAHTRGKAEMPAAFVHHRAVPEVSMCEMRVGRYTPEDVAARRSQAHNQRLIKLSISLWKFVKTNRTIDLKRWSSHVLDIKKTKFFGEVVEYGLEVLAANVAFILDDTLPRAAELLQAQDPRIEIEAEAIGMIQEFLKSRSRDWALHTKITREALELFLTSPAMAAIRYRLCCCLCHPHSLSVMPDLIDLDTATDEWRSRFLAFVTLQVTFIFLTIDWIGIWEKT